MLKVNGPYFPGTTEPVRKPDLEAYLSGRSLDDPEAGTEMADGMAMVAEAFDCEVYHPDWKKQGKILHDGPLIDIFKLAVLASCMTRILWEVEYTADGVWWSVQAGVFNDTWLFLILQDPSNDKRPSVWLIEVTEGIEKEFVLSAF